MKLRDFLPTGVSFASNLLGIPDWGSNLLAAGTGAIQNRDNPLWGATSGLAQGVLGSGLAGAFNQGLLPGVSTAGMTNPMWKGFQYGIEEAIPAKNLLFGQGNTTPFSRNWAPSADMVSVDMRNIPGNQMSLYTENQYPQGYQPTAQRTSMSGGRSGAGGLLGSMFGGGGGGGGGGNLLPYALMGIGSLMPNPKYNVPTGQEMMSKYGGGAGVTPTGQLATGKIDEYITDPSKIGGTATTSLIEAFNAQQDRQDALDMANFKSDLEARGYNAFSSDYNTAVNNFQQQKTLDRNVKVNTMLQQVWTQQVNAQLQLISQAYGIDQTMLQDLINLDIYSASAKYGIEVGKVEQFRKAIYDMALMTAYKQNQNENNMYNNAINQATNY